jgi:hypothetical protein
LSDRIYQAFNYLDVVPCAWNAASFKRIKHIYDPDDGSLGNVKIKTPHKIKKLVDNLEPALLVLNYWQPTVGASLLPGSIYTPIVTGDDEKDFFAQVGYQHIYEYITLLGLKLTDIVMPPSS